MKSGISIFHGQKLRVLSRLVLPDSSVLLLMIPGLLLFSSIWLAPF